MSNLSKWEWLYLYMIYWQCKNYFKQLWYNYKNDNNIKDKEKWSLKRHKALERAKYKCEECGSITNLEVYTKEFNNNEELIVLCKMCYEKNIGEMKLHCQ